MPPGRVLLVLVCLGVVLGAITPGLASPIQGASPRGSDPICPSEAPSAPAALGSAQGGAAPPSIALPTSKGHPGLGADSTPSGSIPANASVPGAPNITAVIPGPAEVTVTWSAPNGTANGSANVTGYRVAWGFEGGSPFEKTVPAAPRSLLLTNLTPFAFYHVNVTAFNLSGDGPPSPSVRFTLTAWTIVAGAVQPAGASVQVDSVPVAIVGGAYSINTSYSPHLVSASAPDYRTEQLVVLPVWNGTSWGNLSLTLLPGTIEGYVLPVTSNVSWDAASVPVNGAGLFEFSVADGVTGTLSVSYPGLIPWEGNLTAIANRTLWQNVTLAAPNATLSLHVAPASATLFVDGTTLPLNTGGNASRALPAGSHALEALADGYYPFFANLSLTAGELRSVWINLTAQPSPVGGNATGRSADPLEDPVVLGLLGGVAVLAVVVLWLGRRGRRGPERMGPAEDGVEETDARELPEAAHSEPLPPR